MKKITFLLVILNLILISCSEKEDKQIIGKWEDNIKLSEKQVEFSNQKDSVKITTEGKNWWFNSIEFNNKQINFNRDDSGLKNFIIENSDFRIERKNSQEIYILINKNKTNKKRILLITLQAGDYFDRIEVTQKK